MTTPTGIPITLCTDCNREHPVTRQHRAVLGPRHGTDDIAAYAGIGIRTTARQNAKRAAAMDRSITETARLMKRISQVTGSLARVEHQIARADQ